VASNHSQIFDTMKAASLCRKCIARRPGHQAVQFSNGDHGGARALGLDSRPIEVGKRADLILVNIDTVHHQPVNDIFSQIVHCAKASDVQTVIVDGEIVMRDRQLMGFDDKKILADAKAANRNLMERVSGLAF
jgi:5-methylthioadenosine/S-adenosylhomocysteine deaminase